MGIETLNAMNEGMHLNLLMIIEVIMLINILLAIAGFVIYLVGTAWYCFGETRQPPRRQMKSAPEPPAPDEDDLLAVLAALDEYPGDNLTGVPRCDPALQRISSA